MNLYNSAFRRVMAICMFVCVEVLRPGQPKLIMSSAVSLPNHTFTGRLSPLSG